MTYIIRLWDLPGGTLHDDGGFRVESETCDEAMRAGKTRLRNELLADLRRAEERGQDGAEYRGTWYVSAEAVSPDEIGRSYERIEVA